LLQELKAIALTVGCRLQVDEQKFDKEVGFHQKVDNLAEFQIVHKRQYFFHPCYCHEI
jgi:hypothetical protein